jgi:CPA1 family monovalent cation:H+ antiporter
MLREILGAAVIGFSVNWLAFQIFVGTQDVHRRIFTSILAVSLSYYLCEMFGCSGAIACVVCGVSFSAFRDDAESKKKLKNLKEFDSFWETADVLLNSVLYVIMGLTLVRIIEMPKVIRLSVVAIALNFICRYASVYLGSFIMGKLPKGYNHSKFAMLFTWGGLRGGLSIALAMSTKELLASDQFYIILGCIYAVVFFTTVVQGLSMEKMYEHLSS